MTQTLVLIAVLIVCAMAAIVAEICTPVFGVLIVSAFALLAWASYLAFTIDPTFGFVLVTVLLIGTPVFIYYAVRILPKTFLGKHLEIKQPDGRKGQGTPEAQTLETLIGRTAQAETPLRPSGNIRVDGMRVVAQAESGMIERGATVRIVRASGTYVFVRKADEPS